MNKKVGLLMAGLAAAGLVAALPRAAPAAEEVHVIEKNELARNFAVEIAPLFAYQLNPKFVSGLGGGLAIDLLIHNFFGVEMLGYYFAAKETSFTGDLGRQFAKAPPDADRSIPVWTGVLALRLTPVYGKTSFMGLALADMDLFFTAGAGVISTTFEDKNDETGAGLTAAEKLKLTDTLAREDLRVTGTISTGFHVYFARWIALRVELRDFAYSDYGRSALAVAEGTQENTAPATGQTASSGGAVSLSRQQSSENSKLISSKIRNLFVGTLGVAFVFP